MERVVGTDGSSNQACTEVGGGNAKQTEVDYRSDNAGFQYAPTHPDDCDCPIHRNGTNPFTAPLGMRFARDVNIKPIPDAKAASIYDAHHGYMNGSNMHPSNLASHGIFYQDDIVGAITYRAPLGKRRLDWDKNGALIPRPKEDQRYDQLPDGVRQRAREFINAPESSEVANSEVYAGTKIITISRICIGVDMQNLASCALANSQEQFLQSDDCPDDAEYFHTMVRADFDGSMVRALKDKGWMLRWTSEPTEASNRDKKSVNDFYKWVFLCPIRESGQQKTLGAFSN